MSNAFAHICVNRVSRNQNQNEDMTVKEELCPCDKLMRGKEILLVCKKKGVNDRRKKN